MRLKNRRGMTAMVDAMIFIVVMGLAVSALFAFGGDDPIANDASSVTDTIFSAKLRACDLTDTGESRLVSIPDMAAFYIQTGVGNVMDYIKSILDSLTQRPDSYRLNICYLGCDVTVGTGKGDAVSASVKEFTVTYGGTITADLRIY